MSREGGRELVGRVGKANQHIVNRLSLELLVGLSYTKGRFILGPIPCSAHLELSPSRFQAGLHFSPTLHDGPGLGPCNIKSIGPFVGPKLVILL
jgi:hypothetical protein